VTVRAPVRHPTTRRGLAALRLSHRACADAGTANRVTTGHRPLHPHQVVTPSP
jgi:hypothetical protein